MCLSINDNVTKKIQAQLDKNGYIDAYKLYNCVVSDGKVLIISTQRGRRIKLDEGGFVVSDRKALKLTHNEKARCTVDHGIHVYLRKPNNYNNIVKVRCYKKDFIAASALTDQVSSASFPYYRDVYVPHHAVFVKVKPFKEDLQKIVKRTVGYHNDRVQNRIKDIEARIKDLTEVLKSNKKSLSKDKKLIIKNPKTALAV
jgi:hypothetical protein